MGGDFAFLDPLFCRPALVVEADDGPFRPGEPDDDEAHTSKEFSLVVPDLGDHLREFGTPAFRRSARPFPPPCSSRYPADPLQKAFDRLGTLHPQHE